LWDNDQVALTYARPDGSAARGEFPFNPNGSDDDIAGVTDGSGLVLGLMPHPERFVATMQHPNWAASKDAQREGAGLKLFINAVQHVQQAVGSGI
jgi:phosphoribosylformylglycinamidine synthase